MKIFLIIPTYNEKENLETLVNQIFLLQILDLTLLIIDDNSPDGTGDLAEKLKKRYPIIVIHRQKKQGLGSAYRLGFQYALEHNADLIVQMDADLSHEPKEIPKFIEEIKKGADIVIGSRRIPGGQIIGWSLWRHFCSWSASTFSRLVLKLKTKDITSGYRGYKKEALEKINFSQIKSNGYAFFEEITWLAEKKKLKIKEIPITFFDRQFDQSKLGIKEIIEFFKTIWRLKLIDLTKTKNLL